MLRPSLAAVPACRRRSFQNRDLAIGGLVSMCLGMSGKRRERIADVCLSQRLDELLRRQ